MTKFWRILALILLLSLLAQPAAAQQISDDSTLFLPVVLRDYGSSNQLRATNAVYLNVADIPRERFREMSIFWFGRVSESDNYQDVRVAYNNTELVVDVSTFDRRIWFNRNPGSSPFEDWDAVTLLLQTALFGADAPLPQSYRFVVQFRDLAQNEPVPSAYRMAYRGNGSGWQVSPLNFQAFTNWRGEGGVNTDRDNRGWRITFRIPFSTLGWNQPPHNSQMRMALISHDRDSQAGPPGTSFTWPEDVNRDSPATWGNLRFGLPVYAPPRAINLRTLLIREGENGTSVPDAAVGGTIGNQCPGDPYHIWNEWGNLNYANESSAIIQNQADIADWPCFSKYFVTFPLDGIPPGKVIRSARLVLHHWGGSGSINDPDPARRPNSSFIHAFSLRDDWQENSITWNNAPLAQENLSVLRVGVYNITQEGEGWPGAAHEWDVSAAAASAYQSGAPLRLALYSSDSSYHSGKYFSASETEAWNSIGRPTLLVEYGDP
ncbi:MAG: DNRLRE domain-containing protein [Chloroflexota bacterium]|jgi:hypothetical protein